MTYQRIVCRSAACYHNATILSSGMANFSRPITKQHKLISNLSCRSVSTLLSPSCFPIPSARSPGISSKSIAAFLGGCPQSLVTNITHADTTTIARRTFSDPSSWDKEYEGLKARRNKSIIMHPEGQGQHILPGNFVAKKHPKTGAERKVILEHALGYFWALNVRIALLEKYKYAPKSLVIFIYAVNLCILFYCALNFILFVEILNRS